MTDKTSCDFGRIENPVAKIGTWKVQTLTGSSSETTTAIDLLSSDLESGPRNWPSLSVSSQSATKRGTCHFDPSRKNYKCRTSAEGKNPKLRKSHRRPQVLFITLFPIESWATLVFALGGGRSKIRYPTFWFWVECRWSQVDPRSGRGARAILYMYMFFPTFKRLVGFGHLRYVFDAEWREKSNGAGPVSIGVDLAELGRKNRQKHVKIHVFSSFHPLPRCGENSRVENRNQHRRKHKVTLKAEKRFFLPIGPKYLGFCRNHFCEKCHVWRPVTFEAKVSTQQIWYCWKAITLFYQTLCLLWS